MRVTRSADTPVEPLVDGQFSGRVVRQELGRFEQPGGGALLVTFSDGARTGWHRHTEGQVLFVVEGDGRTGSRDVDEVALRAGDLVYAEPGEEHWHGAAGGASMTHLALSFGQTEWLGLVDEDV